MLGGCEEGGREEGRLFRSCEKGNSVYGEVVALQIGQNSFEVWREVVSEDWQSSRGKAGGRPPLSTERERNG